jgi:hypothetical protein
MRLAAAAFVLVLAGSAAAVPTELHTFSGTLTGKLTVKVQKQKRRKVDVAGGTQLLYLQPTALRWSFNGGTSTLSGPMKAAKKPGVFLLTKPLDSDLTVMENEVGTIVATYASTPVAVTSVKIAGKHVVPADYGSDVSKITLSAKGITAALAVGLKVKIRLKLAYSGQQTM